MTPEEDIVKWIRWFVSNVKDPEDFRWKAMAQAADELESEKEISAALTFERDSALQERDELVAENAKYREALEMSWDALRSNRLQVPPAYRAMIEKAIAKINEVLNK